MNLQQACITDEQLESFSSGELLQLEYDRISVHLENCESCSRRFARLDESLESAFIAHLQSQLPLVSEGDSELNHLVEAAAALRDTSFPGYAETAAGERLVEKPSIRQIVEQLLAPAESDDEIGRLGGYRILEVRGIGGMGIVFKAEDLQLKRSVAIKAMLPHVVAASETAGERFLREAQAAAAVHHDNVVTIHQVDQHEDVPYLAMELLEGKSLGDRLKRDSMLTVTEACRIVKQSASGLAAAHGAGLTHRDIKPDNLWLESTELKKGSGVIGAQHPPGRVGQLLPTPFSRVKILDFGLARATDDESNLTHSGMIVGTPSYLAPEQARGEAVDARSDLFSLGVVFYQMLTGVKPFERKNTMATLRAIENDVPEPPANLRSDVSNDLSDLVMRLLEKDPADRMESAANLITAIEELNHSALDRAVAPASRIEESGQLHQPRSVGQIDDAKDSPSAIPVAQSDGGSATNSRRRMIAAAAGAFGLLIAAILIYVKADNGTIVVTADGFDVTTENEVVTIRDADSKQEFKVRVGTPAKLPYGEYVIHVDDNQGLSFETKHFTVSRHNRSLDVRLLAVEELTPDDEKQPTNTHQPISRMALVQSAGPITARYGNRAVEGFTIETKKPLGRLEFALHPNSRHFATFTSDGSVRIWDTDSGKLGSILVGHNAPSLGKDFYSSDAIAVAWDADGSRLATTDMSGLLIVWRIELDGDGSVTHAKEEYRHQGTHRCRTISWSPLGTHLAASVLDGKGTIQVFDVRTAESWSASRVYENTSEANAISPEVLSSPFNLAWHEDEHSLKLAFTYRSSRFYVWDLSLADSQPSGTKLPADNLFQADQAQYKPIAWSPNGEHIATRASAGATGVYVWETTSLLTTPLQERKPARFLPVENPQSVVWAPGRQVAVTQSYHAESPKIYIWDPLGDADNVNHFDCPPNPRYTYWVENGNRLFVSTLGKWTLIDPRQPVRSPADTDLHARVGVLTPDGKRLFEFIAGRQFSGVSNVGESGVKWQPLFPARDGFTCRLSTQRNSILYCAHMPTIVNLATGGRTPLLETRLGGNGLSGGLAFDATGTSATMVSPGHAHFSIWNEQNQPLDIPKSLSERATILAAAVTSDGNTIAAVSEKTEGDSAAHKLHILRRKTGESIFELPLGKSSPKMLSATLTWSANGESLVVKGMGRLLVFSSSKNAVTADRMLNELTTVHAGYLDGVSPTGDTLVYRTYASPPSVLVLDATNLTLNAVIEDCCRATYLPNGNIQCLTTEGKIVIRSATDNRVLSASDAAFPATRRCSYSEDGRYLLSQFPYSRLYDVRNERLLLTHFPDTYKTSHTGFKGVISANGHYRADTAEDLEHICYVVKFANGDQEMFAPIDFTEAFDWRNDPQQTFVTLQN